MVDAGMRRINEATSAAQSDLGARAAAGGSFGGSREAVGRAMLDEDRLQQASDLASKASYDAYNTGAQLARGNADAETAALQAAGNDIYGRAQGAAAMDLSQINDRFNRGQGAANFDLASDAQRFNQGLGAANFNAGQDDAVFGRAQGSANYDASQANDFYTRLLGSSNFNAGQDDAYFGRGQAAANFNQDAKNDLFNRAQGASQFGFNALQAGANYNTGRYGALNAGLNDYFNRNAAAMGMLGQYGGLERGYDQQMGDRDYTTYLRMQGNIPGIQGTTVRTEPSENPSFTQQVMGAGMNYVGGRMNSYPFPWS